MPYIDVSSPEWWEYVRSVCTCGMCGTGVALPDTPEVNTKLEQCPAHRLTDEAIKNAPDITMYDVELPGEHLMKWFKGPCVGCGYILEPCESPFSPTMDGEKRTCRRCGAIMRAKKTIRV